MIAYDKRKCAFHDRDDEENILWRRIYGRTLQWSRMHFAITKFFERMQSSKSHCSPWSRFTATAHVEFFYLALFLLRSPSWFWPLPHYAGEIWKRRFHSWNTLDIFRPHYAWGIWKRSNSRWFWTDLCLRKTRASKSNHWIDDYRDLVVFEKLCFR